MIYRLRSWSCITWRFVTEGCAAGRPPDLLRVLRLVLSGSAIDALLPTELEAWIGGPRWRCCLCRDGQLQMSSTGYATALACQNDYLLPCHALRLLAHLDAIYLCLDPGLFFRAFAPAIHSQRTFNMCPLCSAMSLSVNQATFASSPKHLEAHPLPIRS